MSKATTFDALDEIYELAGLCARRLAELRRDTGETQTQLAQRLGLSKSVISRLESGRHLPSLSTLMHIAAAFDRRLDITFHTHEHEHGDGTRHAHPRTYDDPNHQHEHGEAE